MQDGLKSFGSAQIDIGNLREVHASSLEGRPFQLSPRKQAAPKPGFLEVCTGEICPHKICPLETRSSKVGMCQTRTDKPGTIKIHILESDAVKITPFEVGAAQVWPNRGFLHTPNVPIGDPLIQDLQVLRIGHGDTPQTR